MWKPMTYKLQKLLFIVAIPLFVILWIVIIRNSRKSLRQDWEIAFSGRVKDFDNGKVLMVTLRNDSSYQVHGHQLTSIIEIGDSLKKDAYSFRYTLFKNNRPDSVTYALDSHFDK